MSRRPPAPPPSASSFPKIKLNYKPPLADDMVGPSTRTRGGAGRVVSGESTYSSGRPTRSVAMKKEDSASSTRDSEDGGYPTRHSAATTGRATRRSIKVNEEEIRAAEEESREAYDEEMGDGEGDDGYEEDAPGEEEDDPEPVPDAEASSGADSDAPRPRKPFPRPAVVTTRTGRQISKPNYVDSPASDDFEDNIYPDADTADEVHDLGNGQSMAQARRKGSGSGYRAASKRKGKGRKRDPDDEAGPSRSKGKSRAAAEMDEDYDGAGDESHEADEDDLPDMEEDELNLHDRETDEEEDAIQAGRRANRRSGGGGRRGGRARDSSDEEGVPRTLRARKQINYALPPPPEDAPRRGAGGRTGVRIGGTAAGIAAAAQNGGFMMNMNLGMAGDMANFGNMPDSDSDNDAPQFVKDLRKEASATAGMALASGGPADPKGGGGPAPTAPAPGVDTVGRFNPEAARADADPLGVDLNVTFDQVGGLDDQINQLKEMVALPLLYPELFQQFGIIPPRGVLFHGPPGTGKTLLARALAASCSTSTTKISFFMRKGADCLSKWVGEAERQLKLLFEEARNAQPSIIFFDEIDGLAPVRSSKQDQIHSSLVATLLALMDGMDGRGQVVVIGATNRPDTVDPALRRPGRFDREFYFPLPSKAARKKIIAINTRKWEPPLEDRFLEELAGQTKGYGGADLRALCTEAALNAIQRTFPQVYKTSDRLLLNPDSIRVTAKDFMASIRKIVPSSARSAASAAAPIPEQLVPLLARSLEKTKKVVDQLLPPKTRPTVLEEAEWEEEENSLEREMVLQSLETLRVYRPRLLIHSEHNLGQRFVGSAILHHMEGYHVQSLDVATLLAQTGGSVETAIVQMFVEAKRHQPSVLFIPSLTDWVAIMPDTAKITLSGLLDSLTPSEPVLVLGLLQGDRDALPSQVANWFGKAAENFLELSWHDEPQRAKFFANIMENLRRRPTDFPDGMVRKRRVLEALPIAPPLPPKPPSQASIAAQVQKDQTMKEIITYRLGPILAELKKKHKKATLSAQDAYVIHNIRQAELAPPVIPLDVEAAPAQAPVVIADAIEAPLTGDPEAFAHMEMPGVAPAVLIVPEVLAAIPMQVDGADAPGEGPDPTAAVPAAEPTAASGPAAPKPFWVDFDLMQNKLMDPDTGYLTTRSFLRDIERMAENINLIHDDTDRRQKAHSMVVETKLMLKDHFQDEQQKVEMERMAAREYARRETKAKAAAAATVVTPAEQPNAMSSPARLNGRRAGTASVQGSPSRSSSATLNPRKRQRADGSFLEGGNEIGQHVPKRSRMDDGTMGASSENAELVTSGGRHHNAVAGSSSAGEASAYATFAPPAGGATLLNGSHPAAHSAAAPPSSLASLMNPPADTVKPSHPDFFVPAEQLRALHAVLTTATADLDVEELEQVRAMCLQRVWKGRRDWDRTTVVEDLLTIVGDYIGRAFPERVEVAPAGVAVGR